ncbi:MAG: hypothetical protein MUC50_16430 [Myxococcota bacterium]|jgi:hypothetical protein|nr:hypothetical protein [Myxococcota bacterium]
MDKQKRGRLGEMKTARWMLGFWIWAAAAAACGSNQGKDGSETGPTGETVTGSDDGTGTDTGSSESTDGTDGADPLFEETEALIEAVCAQLETDLLNLSLEEAFDNAAAFLEKQPLVSKVEHSLDAAGSVLFAAKFTNGMLFSIPMREVDAELLAAIKAAPRPDAVPPLVPLAMTELPVGKAAAFLDFQGFVYSKKFANLAAAHGYDAVHSPTASVEAFRNLNGNAIVYISSHGLYFEWEGEWYMLVVSDEKRTPERDIAFIKAGDFESVRVVLSRGVYVVPEEEIFVSEDTYYAVTDQFIQKYNGAFAKDSVVYVDTCFSHARKNLTTEAPMAKAFRSLGVNAYFGWTNSVSDPTSQNSSEYFFSRLFGDIPTSFNKMEQKTPPIRPSSLNETWTRLTALGYDKDQVGCCNAKLEWADYTFGTHDVMLVPEIAMQSVNVEVETKKHTLEILGTFGSSPGKVLRCEDGGDGKPTNCDELSVSKWREDAIEVDLDTSSSDDSGLIVVEVDGRKSNAMPLTQWNLAYKVTGVLDMPGPEIEIIVTARLLAEIVRQRNNPEQKPVDLLGNAVADFTVDSQVDWKAKGEFPESSTLYVYPEDLNQGTVQLSLDATRGFLGAASLAPAQKKVTISATAFLAVYREERDIDTGALIGAITLNLPVPMAFAMDLSDVYGEIPAGNATVGELSFDWQTITPSVPPSDKTQH